MIALWFLVVVPLLFFAGYGICSFIEDVRNADESYS